MVQHSKAHPGWKKVEGKLAKKYGKESAGKILGAAAKKDKSPSVQQKRVLKAQKGGKGKKG